MKNGVAILRREGRILVKIQLMGIEGRCVRRVVDDKIRQRRELRWWVLEYRSDKL